MSWFCVKSGIDGSPFYTLEDYDITAEVELADVRGLVCERGNYGSIALVSGHDLHENMIGQGEWRVVGCGGVSRYESTLAAVD